MEYETIKGLWASYGLLDRQEGLGRQPALMGHELKLRLGQVGRGLGLQSGADEKVLKEHHGPKC